MVHDVAQGLGSPLPPRSPHAKALRVGTYSLEPFECGYLPLLVYVVTHGVFPAISHYFLRKRGFVQSQDCGVLVWTEQQALQRRAGGAAGAPIVLIHGIGVGLLPYMSLIRQLFEAERGPLILIELPSISLRIWSHVPTREETVAVVRRALNVIGHESGEETSSSAPVGLSGCS